MVLVSNIYIKAKNKKLLIATEATYPPFEFLNDKNQIVGFDIELIKELCREMKLEYKIVHYPFDSLIIGIKTGKFDLAISAIEITKSKLKEVNFSNPYFYDTPCIVYHGNLKVELGNLKNLDNKKIGIQRGTSFEKLLKDNFGNQIKIILYDSNIEGLMDFKNNKLDAFIADNSIIQFWLNKQNCKFKTLQIRQNKYRCPFGIAVNKNNFKLLRKINQALNKISFNEKKDKILNKYIRNKNQYNMNIFIYILKGSINTVYISLISLIIGIFLSLLFIATTIFKINYLDKFFEFLLYVIRSLPELLIIMFIYHGTPYYLKKINPNLTLPPTFLATLSLGLIFSSYFANIFKELYQNFSPNQILAASSLGLKPFLITKKIIIPQILKKMLPSINNLWLTLLKDTSIVGLVGISEVLGRAKLISNSSGNHFIIYSFAGIIYLLITTMFDLVFKFKKKNILF